MTTAVGLIWVGPLRQPVFAQWEENGVGPVQGVVSQNWRRRHLTPAQRGAVALKVKPMLEAEAKERQRQAGREHGRGIASVKNDSSYRQPQVRKQLANQFEVSEEVRLLALFTGELQRTLIQIRVMLRKVCLDWRFQFREPRNLVFGQFTFGEGLTKRRNIRAGCCMPISRAGEKVASLDGDDAPGSAQIAAPGRGLAPNPFT